MPSRISKAEQKYLAHHAEPEVEWAKALTQKAASYDHVLVIPAAGEGEELVRALASIPEGPRGAVLTIVVVNGSEDAPAEMHARNARTLSGLVTSAGREVAPQAVIHGHSRGDVLVVDRASPGQRLPTGQGVGLARKIGADLALALILEGVVASEWIHVSDADVLFPEDYFARPGTGVGEDVSACIYPFRHVAESGEPSEAYEAAQQYEATLRYYVLGLRFAGSPYAFHTIGSTLALRATPYARVRGFPRRLAAEDFYLLNKLAKVGRVETLAGAPLRLSSRVSERVPFGTGAAIGRMLQVAALERLTYHPRLFRGLRAWHRALQYQLERVAEEGNLHESLDECVGAMAREEGFDAGLLREALEKSGARDIAITALAAPERVRASRCKEGFDAFRTLKFLHSLRELGLPDLPLREALAGAAFLPFAREACEASSESLTRKLAELE